MDLLDDENQVPVDNPYTKPLLDTSGAPVAQNAIAAARQAKIDEALQRVRNQRKLDADATAPTQADRDNLFNDNLARSTSAGLANALNFTGAFNGGQKQDSALASTLLAQNDLSTKNLADKQARSQLALTQGRQDRTDAEKQVNDDEAATIKNSNFAAAQAKLLAKQDPNSPESLAAVQLAEKYTRKPGSFKGKSAAQLEASLPGFAKAYEVDQKSLDRRDLRADKLDAKALQLSEKQSQVDDKGISALEAKSSPDSASSRQAFGVAASKIQGAQAADALIDQAKHQKGGLDNRQMHELAGSVNKLIGNSNAVSNIESLIPSTASMAFAKAKEYVGLGPQGSGTDEFTDRLAETVMREKEVAQQQIRNRQSTLFGANKALASRRPDEVAGIIARTNGDVEKQFKEWGLPVPAAYVGTSSAAAAAPASSTVDLNAIDAELAKRAGK